jgi:hypothetical protein
VKANNIQQIVEAKFANDEISKSLQYFHTTYNLPAIQVVKDLKQEYPQNGIEVMKAANFLKNLRL